MTQQNDNATVQRSAAFPYSPIWRALAFFVPAAIFAFAIRGLIRASRETNLLEDLYVVVALACTLATLGPHLFIAGLLSGSFRVGDKGVTRVWFGRRRTLAWSKILEVRDFLNQIQVIPARQADTIYVQFYHNLVRPVTFHKMLVHFARRYEVNLMLRPTTRRFLPVRWRQLVLLALIVGTGLVVFTVRLLRTDVQMSAMIVGLLAGCTYTTVSAALWMTVSKSHKRIRAQALMFYAIYFATLLLPLLVLGVRQMSQQHAGQLTNPLVYGLAYVFAYVFGFFSGSGLIGLFYPNRALEPKDHATEVLGGYA